MWLPAFRGEDDIAVFAMERLRDISGKNLPAALAGGVSTTESTERFPPTLPHASSFVILVSSFPRVPPYTATQSPHSKAGTGPRKSPHFQSDRTFANPAETSQSNLQGTRTPLSHQ